MAKTEKKTNQVDLLGVYQYLSRELQQAKDALMTEVRMASAQIGSLHGDLKDTSDKSMMAVSQEIRFSYKQNQTIYDGLASMLTKEVGERLNSIEAMLGDLEKLQQLVESLNELKYGYMNMQSVCDATQAMVANEVNPKLDSVTMAIANEVNPKLDALTGFVSNEINALLAEINNKLVALPTEDDYAHMIDSVVAKTEEISAVHSRQVVEAVAALPTAENVDYTRIVEEVGDKVLDLLQQVKGEEPAPVLPVETKIDYDRIICGAAEKVIESLPAPEKIDYSRFVIDTDALAEKVAAKVVIPEVVIPEIPAAPEVDYERLAALVASKIVVPAAPAAPAAPEVDYERLADLVVEKMTATTEKTCEVMLDEEGINEIATKVADKIMPTEAVIDYDRVCQAAQAAQILPDPVDYDRIAEIVEDKINAEEPTYDLVIDEEGIVALAKGVSEELCQICAPCTVCEVAPVEETVEEPVVEETPVEEVVEEPVAEETPVEEVVEEPVVEETPVEEVVEEPAVEETPVEEVVEEPVAEETPVEEVVEEPAVEETPVEEVVEEPAVEEELAVTASGYQEVGDELIDAETGLVIRLKRSFTAKMKQSEEKVKGYYSDIKNELSSYKKINSNVSWHGDRFNFGRDTVAKMNICGKTLCFYLDLDPNDPELKSTVYHQKDVGAQKAYESTPFMVKIKSDAAAKKALRLVGYLAEKLGTEKDESFQPVDYAGEFAYASTKQLFDEGFIKATKEKKVDLNF